MEVQTIRTGEPRTQSNEIENQEGNGLSTNREAARLAYAKGNAKIGLVVATLVATVTFAAIFTVPYPKDGTSTQQQAIFTVPPPKNGTSTQQQAIFTVPPPKNGTTPYLKQVYSEFVIANSLAFVFSTASMFIHFCAFLSIRAPGMFFRCIGISVGLNQLAIFGMVGAYWSSLYAVVACEDPILAGQASWMVGSIFFAGVGIFFALF